ncbi:MAG: hypothetical protein WCQ82_07815 [Bacteroidaceae bacterium]
MNKHSRIGALKDVHRLFMYKSYVVLMLALFSCSITLQAAPTANNRVTIKKKNVSISTVISAIEKQTQFTFFYQ